ncbi:unnamed protein product [Schistocephalus solidus]|uniref:Uncharacterized protein n=1 Tax=Schistocephalus solidus TaxID=70667 RepID=A0A183TGQ8_SCHSO|nr:unnamed protein product [Schistocephalus solidus]
MRDLQSLGGCNDNGLLLCTFAEHFLLLTHSLIRLPTREKPTWMDPQSRCWQLLNYVLFRMRDQQDVLVRQMAGRITTMSAPISTRRKVTTQTQKDLRAPDENNSDDPALLREKLQILKRWTEHVENVHNCSSAISDGVIDPLPK